MKYTLLAVNTEDAVNIGDYIQALASSQFLPSVDGFIERENIDEYNGKNTTMIMNGWFMHHPEHWPPSSKITPLFYAFHINVLAKKALLAPQSLSYLKLYEPIGCRDTNTAKLLNDNGIKAYFSGCMTLTLGQKYKSEEKEDKCYIVDACHSNSKSMSHLLDIVFTLIFKRKKISLISEKMMLPYSYRKLKKLRKLLHVASFFVDYKKIVSEETLVNAEYVCQQTSYYNENFKTDEQLLGEAERLVRLYSKAKLVITSRIHCVLPCLGLETPVIYVNDNSQDEASYCRLGGLKDFFNILEWNGEKLIPLFSVKGKISISNHPQNKENWRPYAERMIRELTDYFKK